MLVGRRRACGIVNIVASDVKKIAPSTQRHKRSTL